MRELLPATLFCSLVAGSCATFVYAVLSRVAELVLHIVR